jgi:uncharacterized membrane-anchored protein
MFKALLRMSIVFIATAILITISTQVLAQDPPEINWIEGPQTVDLGEVAQINLNENYIFANAEDTKKISEYLGDPIDDTQLGTVAPNSEYFDWWILFSYDPIGYVKDDEKNKIDSDAILESIKKATDEANKVRVKNGASALNVLGWYEEPHYDSTTHYLTWAVLGEDSRDNSEIVNYNTRLLGRGGVMSANLVTDPIKLNSYKPLLQDILNSYLWKPGKSYAEWRQGDKIAEIGLTALIAGGAGAIAAKTGLLSKIWYILVAGAVAVGSFLVRIFKRIFRRNEKTLPYDNQ